MENETPEQREARETYLRQLCEPLGLTVEGSLVVAHVGEKRLSVDASAIDLGNLVSCLIYRAHQQGIDLGREMVRVCG